MLASQDCFSYILTHQSETRKYWASLLITCGNSTCDCLPACSRHSVLYMSSILVVSIAMSKWLYQVRKIWWGNVWPWIWCSCHGDKLLTSLGSRINSEMDILYLFIIVFVVKLFELEDDLWRWCNVACNEVEQGMVKRSKVGFGEMEWGVVWWGGMRWGRVQWGGVWWSKMGRGGVGEVMGWSG